MEAQRDNKQAEGRGWILCLGTNSLTPPASYTLSSLHLLNPCLFVTLSLCVTHPKKTQQQVAGGLKSLQFVWAAEFCPNINNSTTTTTIATRKTILMPALDPIPTAPTPIPTQPLPPLDDDVQEEVTVEEEEPAPQPVPPTDNPMPVVVFPIEGPAEPQPQPPPPTPPPQQQVWFLVLALSSAVCRFSLINQQHYMFHRLGCCFEACACVQSSRPLAVDTSFLWHLLHTYTHTQAPPPEPEQPPPSPPPPTPPPVKFQFPRGKTAGRDSARFKEADD